MQFMQKFRNRGAPDSPKRDSYKNIASLIQAGEIGKARTLLQEIIASNPNAAFAYFLMGAASSKESKIEDAIAWYDKALAINPELKPALIQKGKALARLDDPTSAAETFNTILEADPKNERALLQLTRLELSNGEVDKAEADLRKTVAINPQNLPARLQLAKLLNRKGRESEALTIVTDIVRDNPKVASAHQAIGVIQEKLGNLAEARSAYQCAAEYAKEPAGALFSLANIHFLMGEFEAAEKIFRDLLATKPKSKKTLYRLAETLSMLGRHDEGIHLLQKDIRSSRRKTRAHGILGVIYSHQQRYELALSEFRAHLQYAPGLAEKLPRLGNELSTPSEIKAACEEAARLISSSNVARRSASPESQRKFNPKLIEALRRRRLAKFRERRGARQEQS